MVRGQRTQAGSATDAHKTHEALARIDDSRLAEQGLTSVEVHQRVEAGLDNAVPFDTTRSFWLILRSNLVTLFNAVVGGCFALLLVLGYWQDALFGFFIIANILIGVVQEFRAKRTLDKLALINTPLARVIRDGHVVELAPSAVLMDDAMLLRAGDQLCADAVVLTAKNLEVDESLLTGEAEPVRVAPGREVLSGSSVVGGEAVARVVRVGADSYASTLTAEARAFTMVHSEIRAGLDRVILWISWALVPIGAVVVNGQMQAAGGWALAIESGAWREAAVAAIASIISMVPQGLVFITSVAFAVGAVKLARRQVLVQELAAVEVLARVDVICLDKTGTLTENVLVFNSVEPVDDTPEEVWGSVLGWFGAERNANATAEALAPQFNEYADLRVENTIPFASTRKWAALGCAHGNADGTWVLGAPEVLFSCGVSVSSTVVERVQELAESGLRTLILARSALPLTDALARTEQLPEEFATVAIITFREKTRPDAASTLAFFREQGVQLRVLSGDNPRTVAAVAREVGMELIGPAYDARMLPEDGDELTAVLEKHHVFGRVSSSQKKSIVIALQRAGHVVAMTGDGVNDALALKQADIGIAMGSGAATTRAVARLVLLDGQFSQLPHVVAEGRQVIANVERLSKLFLTKTVYAILFALVFGLALWSFPFLPRQLSAVDGLTIGLPALLLALLANPKRYEAGFLRRAARICVPFGLAVGAAVVAVSVFAMVRGGFTALEIQGASVITLTLVGLWVLVVLARPLDLVRLALVIVMYIALFFVFIVPLTSDFFLLTAPPAELLVAALAISAVGSGVIEILHRFQARNPAQREASFPE
ncbi:MAG: HAD-IC family P-type ATPase [Microbacteriaceae bacterium]